MQETKKIHFFKRIIIAIKDFDQYQDFAIENISEAIKYFLKLMIIFAIIISIGFSVRFNKILNDGTAYLKNALPNFTFLDNTLNFELEEPIYIQNENPLFNVIIIDTITQDENQKQKVIEELNTYGTGIVFFKDKVVLKGQGTSGIAVTYNYTDIQKQYEFGNFNKENIVNLLTNGNIIKVTIVFFVITCIYMFFVYIWLGFLDVLLLSILGYVISRLFRLRLKFGPIFNISTYALTLSILLNAIYIVINVLTGFEIKYFGIMYNTISYIYLITAIILIKSDIIKKQTEFMRVVEEQEKIKLELERKKAEEEERRKEEESKKEEKEKNESKKKKKKDDGTSPEGSEA